MGAEALSAAVLGDPAELSALEAIVHPAVHHERTRFIVNNGDAKALLADPKVRAAYLGE